MISSETEETVTIGFYILVSYYREQSLSLEAGLKYLVQGAQEADTFRSIFRQLSGGK